MLESIFLVAALALPPANFAPPLLATHPIVEELRDLRRFIEERHPGAEINIIPPGQPFDSTHWERLPFLWRDHEIFIKRAPVHDTYRRRRRETSA
jgi:hypothetical protein